VGESRAVFRDLAERYAAAIDAADPDALAALFAPGGGLVIRAGERTLYEFRDERLRRFAVLIGETYESTLHHVTTHVVDGERATTWCLAHHVTPGRELETVGVRYADSFARVDGEWRFALREVTALWVKVEPLPRVGLTLDRALAAVPW
jgi:hypothetical protein